MGCESSACHKDCNGEKDDPGTVGGFPGIVKDTEVHVAQGLKGLDLLLDGSPRHSKVQRRATVGEIFDVSEYYGECPGSAKSSVRSSTSIAIAHSATSDFGGHIDPRSDFLQELEDMVRQKVRERSEMEEDRGHATLRELKTGFVDHDEVMPVSKRVAFRSRKSRSFKESDLRKFASVSSWDGPPTVGSENEEGDGEEVRRRISDKQKDDLKKQMRRSHSVLEQIGRRPSMALQIMIENPRDIYELYHISKKALGKGSFGVVSQGRVKSTHAFRAVKSMVKGGMGDSMHMIKMEIKISKEVDHPHAVKLYEIFEDALNLYLVMELCAGGSLLDRVLKTRCLSECHAAIAMHQVFCAVVYLHNSLICHRDIKPENVLLQSADPLDRTDLKLSDFGISCHFKPGQVLKGRVGTMAFMAPQVIQKKYGPSCDVWSCGVMLYFLLSGGLPFMGKSRDDVYDKICKGRFTFTEAAWVDSSQETMDFVRQLLTLDQKKRPSPKTALHHSWFEKHMPHVKRVTVETDTFRRLVAFKSENRFKRAGYSIIASLLSKEQVRDQHAAWQALDHDGDGIITKQEVQHQLTHIIECHGKDATIAKKILRQVEAKGFSDTTYTEFMAATFDRHVISDNVCRAAFSAFDQDCNGSITMEELANGSLLGNLSLSELGKLVDDVDTNGDGEIDFAEFRQMMTVI